MMGIGVATRTIGTFAAIVVVTAIITGCGSTMVEESPLTPRSTDTIAGSSIFVSATALDDANRLHIVFVGGDRQRELRYRVDNGPAEIVTMIGQPGQMEFNLSLALTDAGVPGIAYEQDGRLFYSERSAAGWLSKPVDSASQVGYFPSLAYDHASRPHISYFDHHNNDIKYATRLAEGWQTETVDASGLPGFHIAAGFTRIAVGCWPAADHCTVARPQMVYLVYRYKPYDGELRHAVRLDYGWQITTIDGDKGAGAFPSLVLDAQGHPWVSYYRASTWDFAWGELRLASLDDGGWHVETLDQGTYVGRYNALALDPTGQPVVAYYAAEDQGLRAIWRAGPWHRALIKVRGGGWVTLAIDAQSTAYLTSVNMADQRTHYAIVSLPKSVQNGDN